MSWPVLAKNPKIIFLETTCTYDSKINHLWPIPDRNYLLTRQEFHETIYFHVRRQTIIFQTDPKCLSASVIYVSSPPKRLQITESVYICVCSDKASVELPTPFEIENVWDPKNGRVFLLWSNWKLCSNLRILGRMVLGKE